MIRYLKCFGHFETWRFCIGTAEWTVLISTQEKIDPTFLLTSPLTELQGGATDGRS